MAAHKKHLGSCNQKNWRKWQFSVQIVQHMTVNKQITIKFPYSWDQIWYSELVWINNKIKLQYNLINLSHTEVQLGGSLRLDTWYWVRECITYHTLSVFLHHDYYYPLRNNQYNHWYKLHIEINPIDLNKKLEAVSLSNKSNYQFDWSKFVPRNESRWQNIDPHKSQGSCSMRPQSLTSRLLVALLVSFSSL